MKLFTNQNYNDPEKRRVEVVERKGVGHPDTLADALAEECSRVYSKKCLEQFGFVLHHNIDKVYVGAGLFENTIGSYEKKYPIKVRLNGRVSNSYAGINIDLDTLFKNVIKEYLGCVMPHLDVENDVDININCTQFSKLDNWYAPKSVVDLPEEKQLLANDTSSVTAFYPFSICEKLALELEKSFWSPNEKLYPIPKYSEVGQDIKVMVSRVDSKITVFISMPVICTAIKNEDEYYKITKKHRERTQKLADQICALSSYTVEVLVNHTVDDELKKSGHLYLLAKGTCAECGEEGTVGRGNSGNGIISTFRPNTVEAPAGKNPKYHTGRVLGFLSNILSKEIYKQLGVKNQVLMLTWNKYSLIPPYIVEVSGNEKMDEKEVNRIISEVLDEKTYLLKILDHRNLI